MTSMLRGHVLSHLMFISFRFISAGARSCVLFMNKSFEEPKMARRCWSYCRQADLTQLNPMLELRTTHPGLILLRHKAKIPGLKAWLCCDACTRRPARSQPDRIWQFWALPKVPSPKQKHIQYTDNDRKDESPDKISCTIFCLITILVSTLGFAASCVPFSKVLGRHLLSDPESISALMEILQANGMGISSKDGIVGIVGKLVTHVVEKKMIKSVTSKTLLLSTYPYGSNHLLRMVNLNTMLRWWLDTLIWNDWIPTVYTFKLVWIHRICSFPALIQDSKNCSWMDEAEEAALCAECVCN